MTGRLVGDAIRLDLTSFDKLVGGAHLPEVLSRPGVPEALAAVREPAAVLGVDVAGRRLVQTHRAWIDHDVACMLLAVHGDEHQLAVVPPDLLAARLGRVLRLGPRKVGPRERRRVDRALVRDLFHDDEGVRLSAFEVLGCDLAWNLGLTWPGGDLALCILDARAEDRLGGCWLVVAVDEDVLLRPVTTTQVWRWLTTLLADVP